MIEPSGRLTPAAGSATARPSVIQLVFREKGALYAAYIPMLSDGGLFVPTTREYRLGEDIYLLLSLARRPTAISGRRQGCMDHASQRVGWPHSRGRRSISVGRENEAAQAEDRRDPRYRHSICQADTDRLSGDAQRLAADRDVRRFALPSHFSRVA